MLKQIALAGLFSAAVAGCSGAGGKIDDGTATRVPLSTIGAAVPDIDVVGGIYRDRKVINASRNSPIVGELGEVCPDVVAEFSGNAKDVTRDTMSGHGALT